MAQAPQQQPPATTRWIDPATGRPDLSFYQYMSTVDALLRLLASGTIGPLVNAANDAAAAAAGVKVNGLYRTGNVVQIRLV